MQTLIDDHDLVQIQEAGSHTKDGEQNQKYRPRIEPTIEEKAGPQPQHCRCDHFHTDPHPPLLAMRTMRTVPMHAAPPYEKEYSRFTLQASTGRM